MNDEEKPWHEKEVFWKDHPFNEKVIEMASEEVENLIELGGLEQEMKILDLCCGVGRHSVEFAKDGFEVTGVDKTGHYLEEARKRADEEGVDVEFVEEDMRDFKRKDEYDAVLNLFTSFGYFQDEEENMKVLRNVHGSLKSDGVFILDVMGKEIIASIFQEKDWYEFDGGFRLMERSVEKDWSWLKNRRIKIVDGEVKEYEVSHWLYSAKELKDMLKEVGFSKVDIYGSYEGDPYDRDADRLVALARKG